MSATLHTPMRNSILLICSIALVSCSKTDEKSADSSVIVAKPSNVTAAHASAGALKQLPWLLGTFKGVGADGTRQDAFYERYSLADDSTLLVESFKDSTMSGAVDSTRYEARMDSLTTPGAHRYVATSITPDSLVFGPLVGVKNGFVWRRGDDSSWTAVIIPAGNGTRRTYTMHRIRRP